MSLLPTEVMVRVGQAGEVVPQAAVAPQAVVTQRAPQVIQPALRVLATPQRLRRVVMSPPIQSAFRNRTRPLITSGSTGFSSRSPAPVIQRNIGTHRTTSGNGGTLISYSALSGIEAGRRRPLFAAARVDFSPGDSSDCNFMARRQRFLRRRLAP